MTKTLINIQTFLQNSKAGHLLDLLHQQHEYNQKLFYNTFQWLQKFSKLYPTYFIYQL